MELDQVSAVKDFVAYIRQLAEGATDFPGSLEAYLNSVLVVATVHQHEPPTWRLLARIFTEAFTIAPLPFDPAWLAYTGPGEVVGRPEAVADPFAAMQHMLRYQIADLRRLAETGKLDDPYRGLGVEPPTGQTWYNFDPATFLDCATYGLNEHSDATECSWADMAIILWLGQIHE